MGFWITDFGAVGDGRTVNTKAIQRAVDACAESGGGRVSVPAGVFVSGAIFLKSNIEFHLCAGAVLQGSLEPDDYPLLEVEGHGYRIAGWWHASLVTCCGISNVSVTGQGVVDGRGAPWWKAKDERGDLWDEARKDTRLSASRPALLFLFDCERVWIEKVQLMNSPMWTLVPVFCRNVTISDVSIKNPWKPYHNCDGIDLVSCSNVRISGMVQKTP